MNFNTLEFLILFLPATALVFYLAPPRGRLWALTAASLIFYGVSGGIVLAAFVFAIAWGFATAYLFGRAPRPLAVIIAVSGPLFFLVMFKYLNFILATAHASQGTRDLLWPFLSVTLPAGISFYTFEMVSYALDVDAKRIAPERDLLKFASFATFFPHLIAGPIMRYEDLRGQLSMLASCAKLEPNVSGGLKFLAVGLFAKVFFADLSGMAVDRAGALAMAQRTALDQLTQIGFWSMQIYYDFWSYSIMAIGLGRLFCVELPVNFREPYLSPNPREFWRRWHITLSNWLRDYVYIPMGGNRAYVRNILFVFALVGLWHGAGWNFVVWGVYHGLLVSGYKLTAPAWDKLPKPIAVALTFALVSFGWPLFFLSLDQYGAMLAHLAVAPWRGGIYRPVDFLYLALLGVVTFALRERHWLHNDGGRAHRIVDSPVVLGAVAFAAVLFLSFSRTFIYFRF